MVIDSKSTRRGKDDRDRNNSRKNPDIGKVRSSPVSASEQTGSASLRRSTRGTTSREKMTPSSSASVSGKESISVPINTRKSVRLEKKDTTPPIKRKLEVLERDKLSSSPLRRSGRGNGKVTCSPDVNRKKLRREKSVKRLIFEAVETSKTAQGVKRSSGRRKKTMNRDTYKALFSQQRRRETVPDLDNEPKSSEKLSRVDISCFRVGGSNSVEDGDDGVQECKEKMEEECVGDNGVQECMEKIEKECVERDCGGGNEHSVSNSNNDARSDHGALEISCLNSKCSTVEAIDDTSQENGVNAFSGSTVGENVILLPWHVLDAEKELERTEKLSQDDSFGDSVPNPLEDENEVECGGDIKEECDKRDCEDGKERSISTSNGTYTHVVSNYGALEILCLNSKYISKDAPDEPSQETFVNAFSESMMGVEIIDDSERLHVGYASAMESQCPVVAILPDRDVVERTGIVSSSSPECYEDNLVGTCSSCCKRRRLDYDSPAQELCSCRETFISEDRVELARCNDPLNEALNDGKASTCAICKLDGKLLCCNGKGCKQSYHLSCLDIPMDDALPRVWRCTSCMKNKIEYGSHSVSLGVEAIWDSREVVNKGLQRQRQFLVQYEGLSHIHNHWVPETRLLLEAPLLVSEFDKRKQDSKWRQEWTVPHRLLKKRVSLKHHDNSHNDTSNCQYEWLVKWCGLDYEHATWELESSSFFHSPQVQSLVREFENRHQRAKGASTASSDKNQKRSIVKPPKLAAGCSFGNEHNQHILVNKLCEFWGKGQNAIVIDDQEKIADMMLVIASLLSDVTQPFLIISSSDALSVWESEFSRLAPFINVVVYSGNQDSRNIIRTNEFYADRDRMMVQVLLSSVEAIIEDIEVLLPRWEVVIVDECQDTGISKHFEQLRRLRTSVRILLFNGQLKESTAERLNLLSLLDSPENLVALAGLESCELRERLSPFIAYNCKTYSSRFVEYWIPVSISNVQLEQYCATLLSNSTTLRSSSFKDIVGGALHDILISTKKCCDHPYFVDSRLQGFLTKDLPPVEYLDVGIKASGKLQLLDIVLSEIKSLGKRVVILYQSTRSAGMLTGDILDDFLRQRFGLEFYERVDRGIARSKKQAALNKFNDKGSERFVFLLERTACSPTIKLTSVDAVFIFDSDWNLMNDNRAVQKLSIDSSLEPIKIFRLYTFCTLEEKVLDLATNNVTLDSTLHNISRTTSHILLMWGATYLFSKLDGFHGTNASNSGANLFSDISILKDVAGELLDLLIQNAENSCKNSLITKVQRTGVTYSKNAPLFGQSKVKSSDGKVPHLFWNEILVGKTPRWRFLSGYSHRNRKRVQYFDDLPEKPGGGPDGVPKKQKKITNNSAEGASPRTRRREGGYGLVSPKSPGSVPFLSNNISAASEVPKADLKNGMKLRDVQKNLHVLLKSTISELNETLQLPEDVKTMGETFLEYIVDNHQIHSEPSTILQAFQISLVWISASLVRYKLDKKQSLDVAKQCLGFCCTEVEVTGVHSKLRLLQKEFKERSEKFKGFVHTKDFTDDRLERVLRKCEKRKIKLLGRHEEEIEEFNKIWEKQRAQIENQHRIDSAVVRTIHHNHAVRLENLKKVDEVFAKKMDDHRREKELRLQELRREQLEERIEEDQKERNWLKEVSHLRPTGQPISLSERVGPSENKFNDGQENLGSTAGKSEAPNRTEITEVVATTVPLTTAGEIVGGGLSRSDRECNKENSEHNDKNLSGYSNKTSGSSRHDANAIIELPLVISPAVQIPETRAQDVVSLDIAPQDVCTRPSTSTRNLNGDATECENSTNIPGHAEVELLHRPNAEARQADSCAASRHANESYNVMDLIEDGTPFARPDSELTAHHLPCVEVEQSTVQSAQTLLPPLPTRIVDEVLHHDASQIEFPRPTDTPAVELGARHPSRQRQQMNLPAQPRPFLSDPLQFEVERLQKETEAATKFHEDTKLLLKSEYEKELEEVIAELGRKYDTKLKGAEAEYLMKKEELDIYQNKVFMNKILSEAFRIKCSGFRPVPSTNFLRQLLLLSSHFSGSPNYVPPAANQQTAVSSVPAPPRSSLSIASTQMWQPHTFPNTRPIRNFPVSGEMRAPAPHLRPSLSASAPSTSSVSLGLAGQDLQRRPPFSTIAQVSLREPTLMSPQPQPMQPPSQPIYRNLVSHPETMGFQSSSLPAVGLLNGCPPNAFPCTSDSGTNFVGPCLSQGGKLGGNTVNDGINLASSSIETDVIYLTDDE